MRVSFGMHEAFFLVATGLLAAAVVVDRFHVSPRLDEVARLEAESARVLGQFTTSGERKRQERELAGALKLDSLEDVFTASREADPLAYLGQLLDASKLTRLEVTTRADTETDALSQTRFSLRVLGSFPDVLDFVRDLESGSRLVTIESFAMEARLQQELLEARFSLTIHDPKDALS